MVQTLQVVAIILPAIGMGLSLAHALEPPGKLRLDRDAYQAVQTIYYPGFTIGGAFGEPGAILATCLLLIVMPYGTPAFWLTLAALVCLLIEHGLFWLITQPVNKLWLKEQNLSGASAAFFATDADVSGEQHWTALRDRWEYSHLARAAFAMLGLIALVLAVASPA